ncbi:MAG: zinc-dependent metalloprotease [Acidimicrobiales bacterium]
MTDGDDFPGGFLPFDLNALFSGGAGDPWATASQMAGAVASGGNPEPNLDPLTRMDVEALARVAELHVAQAPGVTLPATATVVPVTKTEWTRRSVTAYRPFFERFGEALGSAVQAERDADPGDPLGMMLGQMMTSLGPMLVAASAGSMIGHLGSTALGQYDLPVPRLTDDVLVVPSTIDATAADWHVPVEELRLWVLIHELTTHAVLSTPHVRRRLESLLIDFAAAFRPNPDVIADQLSLGDGPPDLSRIQELSEQLNSPDAMLSMMRSPAHDLLVPQLNALLAAILGFVDHTVGRISQGLVASQAAITEEFRSRWVEVAPADRMMERLLGLDITQTMIDRGDAFITGVVERAGDEGLVRLWADDLDLPTAAEVDAPGLWLTRIGLGEPEDAFETDIPDDLSGLAELGGWGLDETADGDTPSGDHPSMGSSPGTANPDPGTPDPDTTNPDRTEPEDPGAD